MARIKLTRDGTVSSVRLTVDGRVVEIKAWQSNPNYGLPVMAGESEIADVHPSVMSMMAIAAAVHDRPLSAIATMADEMLYECLTDEFQALSRAVRAARTA